MIPGNFMDDNSYMDPRNWKIIPNIMLDATDIIYYGDGYLDITKDTLVGYEEVTATPTGNNRIIVIDYDPQEGVVVEYRVYRGTTSGISDRCFHATTNPFRDNRAT